MLCLLGPTCSGKTELALSLAACFPFEIISVDSAMVYRGMDIGTSKPEPDVLSQFPHHIVNICEPDDAYSVGRFCQDAHKAVLSILKKQRIPLLVGGTMLYFKALTQGLSDLPCSDPAIRAKLQMLEREHGSLYLHKRLLEIDPMAAQRIHPHDQQRLQRALEVYEATGQSLTECLKSGQEIIPVFANMLSLALLPSDRNRLHQNIKTRFLHMLESGLLDEVQTLRKNPSLTSDMPSMRAVGYRQVWQYLDGQIDTETMQDQAIVATRQLAKRQMTWLRYWPKAMVFESMDPQLFQRVQDAIKRYLNI